MTTVHNVDHYNEIEFSLPPREAVIAAYAQARGDWATWTYEARYGSRVKLRNDNTWCLGEFAAVEKKDPT